MSKKTSELYNQQIIDLMEWFKNRLANLPEVKMTNAEYSRGHDSLPAGQHRDLVTTAFNVWLYDKNYELSYNQMCNGFFGALNALGKLIVTD